MDVNVGIRVPVADAVGVKLGTTVDVGISVRVGDAVDVGLVVAVRVAVGLAADVGVDVGVDVGDSVRVAVGGVGRVPVIDGVAVGLAVAVDVDVRDGVRVAVGGVGVPVTDGVAVGLAVDVGVEVGDSVRVAEFVGVGVVVWRAVTVTVGVRVGTRVAVGVLVEVGIGSEPMRTTICVASPSVPPMSRTCTASVVSPGAKAFSPLTSRQYCTTPAADVTKTGLSNASIVHARPGDVATSKAQPKSLRAFETAVVGAKSGGSNPGIPPSVQTPGSPSPRFCDASICKSGRAFGLAGFDAKTVSPGSRPSMPGTASTTTRKPKPADR